jgi:hypothetical protein
MKELNYKDIAIYLLDTLCEVYNPNTVIKMLHDSGFDKETLIVLGFSKEDIYLLLDDNFEGGSL